MFNFLSYPISIWVSKKFFSLFMLLLIFINLSLILSNVFFDKKAKDIKENIAKRNNLIINYIKTSKPYKPTKSVVNIAPVSLPKIDNEYVIIAGTILNDIGSKPVIGAHISIGNRSYTTNTKGLFIGKIHIKSKPKLINLHIKANGYKSTIVASPLNHNVVIRLNPILPYILPSGSARTGATSMPFGGRNSAGLRLFLYKNYITINGDNNTNAENYPTLELRFGSNSYFLNKNSENKYEDFFTINEHNKDGMYLRDNLNKLSDSLSVYIDGVLQPSDIKFDEMNEKIYIYIKILELKK